MEDEIWLLLSNLKNKSNNILLYVSVLMDIREEVVKSEGYTCYLYPQLEEIERNLLKCSMPGWLQFHIVNVQNDMSLLIHLDLEKYVLDIDLKELDRDHVLISSIDYHKAYCRRVRLKTDVIKIKKLLNDLPLLRFLFSEGDDPAKDLYI